MTLGISGVEPCAATAGRDLWLRPEHAHVIHVAHRVLVARLQAPLPDERIHVLRAPRAGAEGAAEVPPDK